LMLWGLYWRVKNGSECPIFQFRTAYTTSLGDAHIGEIDY
jgi:hypothetical protein